MPEGTLTRVAIFELFVFCRGGGRGKRFVSSFFLRAGSADCIAELAFDLVPCATVGWPGTTP